MEYSNILELQFDLDQAREDRLVREEHDEDNVTPEQELAHSQFLLRTKTPEEQAAWDAALNNLEAMFAPKAVR